MIILITGKAGSGKSKLAAELSKHIPSFCIVKMADPLYAIHSNVFETLRSYGYTNNPPAINRDLLQDIGAWGRKQHEDFWVRIARSRVNRILLENPKATVCIDDIRFFNELNAFGTSFAIRLKASEECRKRRAQKLGNFEHESEKGLDHIPDEIFDLTVDTENNSVEVNVNIVLKAINKWKNGKQ